MLMRGIVVGVGVVLLVWLVLHGIGRGWLMQPDRAGVPLATPLDPATQRKLEGEAESKELVDAAPANCGGVPPDAAESTARRPDLLPPVNRGGDPPDGLHVGQIRWATGSSESKWPHARAGRA